LFNRGDFKKKAGALDEKTQWLLGDTAIQRYAEIKEGQVALPIRREFPESGYYILGCNFETDREIRVIVDAGPIGYQSIAAHGHADALAFTLSVAGLEFLVDPGTYTYHTRKMWRDYFRGTSAHNTVRIDEQDQSISGGNFMWLRKANAQCEVWEPSENIDRFVGRHDGYTRLNDSVTHRREIRLNKHERKIIVTDTLLCKGTHTVECYWHFSESCAVQIAGRTVKAVNHGRTITLTMADTDHEIQLLKGNTTRPAGWVSRRFDVKVPSPTVVRKAAIQGNTTLTTEITCE